MWWVGYVVVYVSGLVIAAVIYGMCISTEEPNFGDMLALFFWPVLLPAFLVIAILYTLAMLGKEIRKKLVRK